MENGTPQDSAITILFTLKIDYYLLGYWTGHRAALYTDDGAIWKRGRNIPFEIEKMQGAVVAVEEWSLS